MKYAKIAVNIDNAADLLQAVSSSQRLTILAALVEGERSAGALGIIAGVSHSALSLHMSKLHRAGLVSRRRDGRNIFYRYKSPAVSVLLNAVAEMSEPLPADNDDDLVGTQVLKHR